MRLRAPAKLNLGLRIRARRADGYHEIETILVPLDLCDSLELEPSARDGIELEVSGAELASDASNLAARAAKLACAALGFPPRLRIRLRKRIPVAAGLGGGSSDAAAVIRGVERLAGKSLPLRERHELALRLGADVPFFLDPRPALGCGIGAELAPLAGVPEMWWVLMAFPFQVSTAQAYAEAGAELTLPRDESSIAALLGPSGLLSSPPNDLERVAVRHHPEIVAAREALERVGAMITGMSGSGPTVYGRFPDAEAGRDAAGRVDLPGGVRAIVVRSLESSPRSEDRWGVAKG